MYSLSEANVSTSIQVDLTARGSVAAWAILPVCEYNMLWMQKLYGVKRERRTKTKKTDKRQKTDKSQKIIKKIRETVDHHDPLWG